MSWGHDALADDLAAHLRGNSDRLVWTDMQMGPAGSPRPDVYTMQKSYSKFRPLAYECKVSVADFRRDITAGKWQSYLKYSSGVIFAVPAGLIKKEDVPTGCGLIVRHQDVWRTVKGPTMQVIKTLPHDAWMKLMIDGVDRLRSEPRQRSYNTWRTTQILGKKYGEKIAKLLSNLEDAERVIVVQTAAANRTAEQLRQDEQERVARIRKSVEEELAEIRKAKVDICHQLGIDSRAGTWQISSAVHDMKRRMSENGEIDHLRRSLAGALDYLNKGVAELDIMKLPQVTEPVPTNNFEDADDL